MACSCPEPQRYGAASMWWEMDCTSSLPSRLANQADVCCSCWGDGIDAADPLSKVTPAIENGFKVRAHQCGDLHSAGVVHV